MTNPGEVTAGAETRPGSRIGTPRAVASEGAEVTSLDAPNSVAESNTSGASAPVLLEAAYQERQLRFSALDAVEMKAGVTLGFAGTLIALTTAFGPAWSLRAIVIPAMISVLLAVFALIPRKHGALKPEPLRDKYLDWNRWKRRESS